MGLIASVEAALKLNGEKIGRPWPEWRVEDKGNGETYFAHKDELLICVILDEEAIGALSEDEANALVEGSELTPEEFWCESVGYLNEVYLRQPPEWTENLRPTDQSG